MRLPADSTDAPRRSGRWRRWVLRGLACLAALVTCLAVTGLVVLDSVDRPWLKGRLQRLVRASAGVDIDYGSVRFAGLSGIEVAGLAVRSPAEVRSFAPDLVRIDRVDVRWSLRELLFGRGPLARRVKVSGVTLTVVVDENGRTSFDAISAASGPPAPPGPVVPLSHQAAKLLGTAPPLERLDLEDVTIDLVRTKGGEVSERVHLRGVSVVVSTSSAEPAQRGWRVQVALGSQTDPLALELTRTIGAGPAQVARAGLWLAADATSSAVTATVDLRMNEQTFAASVSAHHWLHVEAGLRFDPTAGRTEITLDHAEAGDGAATAEASIEVPDAGDPVLRHARADVDLARLIGWLPKGMLPITAERARLRCQIDGLVAGQVVRLSSGGSAAVDAELSNVTVGIPRGTLEVGAAAVSLHVEPAPTEGMAGQGSMKLAGLRLASGEDRLAAEDVVVDLDGRQATDGTLDGHAALRFARVDRASVVPVVARDGHVDLRVGRLRPDADFPLATRGDLALSIDLASLDARSTGLHALADGIKLRAHTALEGHPPYAAEIDETASRLRVIDGDGNLIVDSPEHVEGWARDVQPDDARPAASRAIVHAAAELGETQASIDATKAADAADFALRATARSLGALRPLLPHALVADVPLDRMSASVQSNGHVEHLGANPMVRQTTEIQVDHAAFRAVAAQRLSLTLTSQGTALRHQADLDLRAQGLTFDAGGPSDDHVALSAQVDRDRRLLEFKLATDGRAATKVSGSVAFDPSRRAIDYRIDGRFAGLAPLAPFVAKMHGLDGFDLSGLEVGLSARGAVLGVVAGVSRDGTMKLEPRPARTAAVEGTTDIRVAHFRWAHGDTAIATPALSWHGEMAAAGPQRTVESRLEVGSVHLDLGARDVDLNGIRDQSRLTITGDLAEPETQLTEHLSVRAVTQDVVPGYPLGDLALALSAERSSEGLTHISEMKFDNGLGGTSLTVTGNVDLGEGQRTLSTTASLTQDLALLSAIPERFKGRGTLAVDATVTSPDLAHYQVRAAVKGKDVTVTLPRSGVDVDSANGEVPITVALEVGDRGVTLQHSEKRSPYSMLRFTDQHPLLSRGGFLSIKRLKTPFVSIAPLVGSLAIEQNVISLRQFEMGVRGGVITGQCGIDWDGPRSTVELHVRATGVQSSHGEPFDGNIEVAISAADRTVEGRAQILRIGERHLLDLIDLQDPLHVDPAMNRIRTLLNFGYPDSLRLVFDHGFASAHLELGGLAGLVSIGELRGIPMGPIIDKMLTPALDAPETKDKP